MFRRQGHGMNLIKVDETLLRLVLSALFIAVAVQCQNQTDVGRPPLVVLGPPPHELFNIGQTVHLPCLAVGTPPIRHHWFRDGVLLHPKNSSDQPPTASGVPHLSDDGTLTLPRRVSTSWQGRYQCHASNSWGIAVSNITYLQNTVFPPYQRPSRTRNVTAREGEELTLPCQPFSGESVPAPRYQWETVSCRRGCRDNVIVQLSDRISIKSDGSLVISYVYKNDSQDGRLYKCNIHNPARKKSHYTGYTRVFVQEDKHHNSVGPRLVYSTQSPLVALEGDHVILTCFFGGWPLPVVTWEKDEQRLDNRRQPGSFSYNIDLGLVRHADDGLYKCRAENTVKSEEAEIRLRVEAIPVITTAPQNIFVEEDHDVTFSCFAKGRPHPNIQWIFNDIPVKSAIDTNIRWETREEGNVVAISKITVNDTGTMHCNASNRHGYSLSSAFVVILPSGTEYPTTVSQTTAPPNVSSTDYSSVTNLDISSNEKPDSQENTSVRYKKATTMSNNVIVRTDGEQFMTTSSIRYHDKDYVNNKDGNSNDYINDVVSPQSNLPRRKNTPEASYQGGMLDDGNSFKSDKETTNAKNEYILPLIMILIIFAFAIIAVVVCKRMRNASYALDHDYTDEYRNDRDAGISLVSRNTTESRRTPSPELWRNRDGSGETIVSRV